MTNDAGLTREQIEEWRATFMDIWRAKLIDAPDWAKPHFAAAIHALNILCDLALKSREAVPEGYVMVPVKPTEEMQDAMLKHIKNGLLINDDAHRSIRHGYRAMLAIASAEGAEGKEGG